MNHLYFEGFALYPSGGRAGLGWCSWMEVVNATATTRTLNGSESPKSHPARGKADKTIAADLSFVGETLSSEK